MAQTEQHKHKIETTKKIKIENVEHLIVHESLCYVSECQSSKYHDHDIKKGIFFFDIQFENVKLLK